MKKKICLLAVLLFNVGAILSAQPKPEKIDNLYNREVEEVVSDLIVKWDESSSVYINEVHGIKWSLPRYLKWTGRPIVSGSTIFKMRNEDYLILVSINVGNTGREIDAWKIIDTYKSPEFIREIKKNALLSETVYIDSKATKELICDIHTNKIVTEYEISQSDFPAGYYRLAYQYQLGNGENVYTFNITGLYLQKAEYEDFGKLVNDIIRGLHIKKL